MANNRILSTGLGPVLLTLLVGTAVCLFSTGMVPASHALAVPAESLAIGGSTCSDFLDGVAVGMGVGVLFGCVWCGAGAVAAKGIALFC